MRKDDKIVKRWWFNNRVKQLLKEQDQSEADNFKASDHWFSAFCRRYGVSLRMKTHTCSRATETRNYQAPRKTKKRTRGKYADCDIANMDQAPLPFVLDDGTV